MKKVILFVIAGLIVFFSLASCAAVFEPLKFNGTWTISSGTYTVERDYEGSDYDQEWEASAAGGTLTVENGVFSFDVTLERDEQEDDNYIYYEYEIGLSGSGVAAWYPETQILNLQFDTLEEDWDPDSSDHSSWTYTYTNDSRSFTYTIDGDNMTLTRTYVSDYDNSSDYTITYTENYTLTKTD